MVQAIEIGKGRARSGYFAALAITMAALVIFPVIAIFWLALTPSEPIWSHLWATTFPRYLSNSLLLLVSVGLFSAIIGVATAWLVVMYRFAGQRWLEWALFAPLAVPAYVSAYAITDFLEYAGPVQSGLRAFFGWNTSADYMFFEVRSTWMAVLVLTSVLYPYTYLLCRAAMREQSGAIYNVARTLGTGGWRLFWKVGLPMARPAIAVGAAIAMMETLADFGVVDFFAVQTLTTGIFSVWLEQSNAGGAAQIACVALVLILLLVSLERISRRRMRFHQNSGAMAKPEPVRLKGAGSVLALLFCLIPVSVGFILPVGVTFHLALENPANWLDPDLGLAFVRTVFVGLTVATVTISVALVIVASARATRADWPRLLLPVTGLGYSVPGAVLAIGILLPLSALDHRLADSIYFLTGKDPGLLLTGTVFAVILACSVRFFAIAQGAADGAMGRVAPSLPMAARSLGKSPSQVLRLIYAPLMRPSIATAALLIFVDTVKELPMTLFLRPFNFHTLATKTYERASLENLQGAAPPALIITCVGMAAVILIIRSNR